MKQWDGSRNKRTGTFRWTIDISINYRIPNVRDNYSSSYLHPFNRCSHATSMESPTSNRTVDLITDSPNLKLAGTPWASGKVSRLTGGQPAATTSNDIISARERGSTPHGQIECRRKGGSTPGMLQSVPLLPTPWLLYIVPFNKDLQALPYSILRCTV